MKHVSETKSECRKGWEKNKENIDCIPTECLAVVIVSTELYLRNELFFFIANTEQQ